MKISEKTVKLINSPTPLDRLDNLSKELGINLYIKRDDMTSLGMGGNKLRKLEYLAYDALENKATMLITVGGAQTNHGRLTAAVAARLGMKCAIVCADKYPGEISANILLDRLMGAEVIFFNPAEKGDSAAFIQSVVKSYEDKGEKVYFIPVGGSNELGLLGYYSCACEITGQALAAGIKSGTVISAAGSLGTYLGLYCGLRNENSPLSLTGIAISEFGEDKKQRLMEYFGQVKARYGMSFDPSPADFHIETGYVREGYNIPNEQVRQAIYLMARKEAIILDPCYTGKAFAGLLDMVREGKIKQGETVIFLHSGGQPGISTPHHRKEFERELLGGIIEL